MSQETIVGLRSLLELLGSGGVWSLLLIAIVVAGLAGVGLLNIVSPIIKAYVEDKKASASQARAITKRVESLASDPRTTLNKLPDQES